MSEQKNISNFSNENIKTKQGRILDLGPLSFELPKGWKSTQIGSIIKFENGVNYSSEYYSEKDEGVVFLTLNSVKKGGGLKKNGIKYYDEEEIDNKKIIEPGEILIANTDVTQDGDVIGYPIKVPKFESDKKIAPSMDLTHLKLLEDELNKTCLKYILKSKFIHDRMRAFSAGSTVLHLNTDLAKKLDIPLPPLPEQRKIATVLYNVDQAIQKTEEIIKQTQRVKKGLMQDLFIEGYFEHDEYIEVSVGLKDITIPEEWKVRRMNRLKEDKDYAFVDGPFGSNLKTSDYVEEGPVRLIQLQNIEPCFFSNSETKYTTKDKYNEQIRSAAEPGDVVLAKMPDPIGRACIVPDEEDNYLVVADVIKFSPGKDLDNRYAMYYFNSNLFRSQVISHATGSTRLRLNLSEYRKLDVILPPLKEQEKIAKVLSRFDKKIVNLKDERDKLKSLKKGLMQDLLTGKVRTNDKDIKILEEVIGGENSGKNT